MHRISKGLPNESRQAMEAKGAAFFTDEGWFCECYGHLDSSESQHVDKGQNGMCWQPHKYTYHDGPDKILGSYGPRIGFMMKAW